MTSEIGVMNKMGVALAADSAVTIGGQKIYNTVNKLFALTKHHPVGIMIYGNAMICGNPWETVIKMYRSELQERSFEFIEDYANDFIDFLNRQSGFYFNSSEENYYIANFTYNFMNKLFKDLEEEVFNRDEFLDNGYMDEAFQVLIEKYSNELDEEFIEGFDEADVEGIINNYSDLIIAAIDESVKGYLLFTKELKLNAFYESLVALVSETITKEFSQNHSGIVIAGFGEKEVFPSLVNYRIDGRINNKLKYALERDEHISSENAASVVPFAQSDMIYTFMEGIDPKTDYFLDKYISNLFLNIPENIVEVLKTNDIIDDNVKEDLRESLLDSMADLYNDFKDDFNEFRRKNNINPIVDMVVSLPKDELGEMAGTLVNLTSFKRKVTTDMETVGGPVDVAVITKGDGFIWIKRKHYFQPEMNQHYFKRTRS